MSDCVKCGKGPVSTGLGRPWCQWCGAEQPAMTSAVGDAALIHPKPWKCRLGRHKMPTDPNKWLLWSKAGWPGWAYAQASCERCYALITNEVQR